MSDLSGIRRNPPPEWVEANIRAGVRVILKRALRAADIPFHHDETTADLLTYAAKSGAPVEDECDIWAETAHRKFGLTEIQVRLMMAQAKRALIDFRRAGEIEK